MIRKHPNRGNRARARRGGPAGDLVLDHVSKTYVRGASDVRALRDVSIRAGAGELVVLLGPSGSGKTTLLNVIGAIEPVTDGTITLSGIEVSSLEGRELTEYRRNDVGFVFQFFNLIPTLTAAENVEVIAELTGPDAATRTDVALSQVGLGSRSGHYPSELSGGEQQRVAIARALVKDPAVILADEPTGSLDLETARQILRLLRSSADSGTTVLIVTHNSAIAAMADRVVHLRDGRVVADRIVDHPIDAEAVDW